MLETLKYIFIGLVIGLFGQCFYAYCHGIYYGYLNWDGRFKYFEQGKDNEPTD